MDYCIDIPIRKMNETMMMNKPVNLSEVEMNTEYVIESVDTDDKELEQFLFSLGCYEGEHITLISIVSEIYVINIKDARYSIDLELAKAIRIQ